MAFIRNCVITAVTVFCIAINTKAQTVYYPAGATQLLKSTAEDAAMLLQKAIAGSRFITQAYTTLPAAGVVLIYDNRIADNQACKVESDGYSYIKFTAVGDNGLHFGIYQYLNKMGFRFYQPGSVWEVIPALATVYKKNDTTYNCSYKYKTWFVSGGHRPWVMDNNTTTNNWDTYSGENGHNWALYQRRNGMVGNLGFKGHRADVMSGDYLNALKNNSCYVANYNGKRQANIQSVPDVFNSEAKELWANTIEQKYTLSKNAVYNNSILYANLRNVKAQMEYIGLEVPDGAQWGNSKENDICNANDYPKESDQHFTLANFTAQKILAKYPENRFQIYAYSTHADIPSASITINPNIDIQIIPAVYQLESSTNGLRNRWYNRSANISEYQYLNLSNWSGETPSFKWDEIETTLQTAKDKVSQGIMWEASPAKFGSLPVLLAANNYLKDNISVDSTLHEFCNSMFSNAGNTVYKILKMWGEENTIPNKYTLPLYLELLKTAVQQTQNAPDVVKDRLRELKAYLHYMVLYFDLANDDQNKSITKEERDAALCIYLAKTNKLQLVNSYYMILTIVSKYPATSDFRIKYNFTNGTAYLNGSLPLITATEIDNNFVQDISLYNNQISQFKFEEATKIKDQFKPANIAPLPVINTKIAYTNGINYYNKTAFHIIAPSFGSFTIQYTPRFNIAGKGYINFLVEAAGNKIQIIKDFSLDKNAVAGAIKFDLPSGGKYILTIVSKYASSVDLSITTNGNYFYKNGSFLGNKTESYTSDPSSLPGYFLIPDGISKIYFRISNHFSSGKYASAEAISKTFLIKDNDGNIVLPRYANIKDSSLFYLEIPKGAAGNFWQATAMAQYNLLFVNISNVLWYAKRNACTNANFKAILINRNGNCTTQLSTTSNAANLNWEVNDMGRTLKYNNQSIVDLPAYISTNAIITLTNGENCSFSKRLSDDEEYVFAKKGCASGAEVAIISIAPVMYPNPSTGVLNCMQNGIVTTADEILVFNTQGMLVGNFKNVKQFNISNLSAGLYVYRMVIKGEVFKGKVIKL